ncbi:MAG: V-type ATP synthase subunit I [Clostridiales bacterium]|nr:V-type ATP synthase subunit I [Clostridiales bacterium]
MLIRHTNKILDSLTSRGIFEVRATDCVKSTAQSGDTGLYGELKLKQGKLSFALDFLKARHAEMAALLKDSKRDVKRGGTPIDFVLSDEKYSGGRTLITRADFSDAAAREYELLHVCEELERISFDIIDCKTRASAIKSSVAAYRPFSVVPLKLSELKRTGDIVISVYYNRVATPPYEALDGMPCAYEVRQSDGTVVIAVCRASDFADVDKKLAAIGYTSCPFSDDCTAEQKLTAFSAELDDIERRLFELTKSALAYEKHVKDLRILYDVIELDIERAEAESKFAKTDSAFVLEGWLPESVAQSAVDEVSAACPATYIQLLAPEERDEPPTLVVNNKVVAPYEDITNMYSPPKYGEIDPNPIMSVFYFLFFGIMVGDAAYGLVLAVAGLVIGMSKKFDTGFKRLALLVGMGGISAVIWGVIFGGYFSIDFGDKQVALWFNPLDENGGPMTMLILSIVLGCVQMVVGYIIKFVALCKEGKPFSAIFDAGSIIILFGALGCLAVNMFLLKTPIFALTVVTIVLAALGVGLILFFGGRNSKNVFGKAIGGFKGLYGLINLLSDVLSYCRLFGLCLASCAIGLAFNTLGGILFEIPYVGYVIGVIILIPLHAFNLGIGVLSAYVHDARLQFLEFYGKFYEGGGRLFNPLGGRTKYIRYN